MRRQMIFNKLKQKIHNLRPSVRKERIRLEAKQEILSVISNELGLDVDGDIFVAARAPAYHATFYVDELSGIISVVKPHPCKPDSDVINGNEKSRKIENPRFYVKKEGEEQ